MTAPLKVVTILGTRPEIIRLSRVMARLDEVCDHRIVHTGQNHDYRLNGVFFADLGVREPDHFLGVDTSSLGSCVGGILIEVEKVLLAERPDAVLILGDTNSAISAYMARRLKIPVYHMEAGNRCFDRNVPEETNRRMVDHISDFNLVYSEHARRNLLAEGLHPRRVYLTGSPMREVLERYRPGIEASTVLDTLGLDERGYILASLHREENVDNLPNLERLVASLDALAERHDCRVVVSTHPRTKKRLDAVENVSSGERVQWLEPFGFNDYNRLQMSALCVVSDSGTIAEESSILGFPAVTPRLSIERPEAVDTGAIMACGTDPDAIVRCVDLVIGRADVPPSATLVPEVYAIPDVSERVARLILSTAGLSNAWDGIRPTEDRV